MLICWLPWPVQHDRIVGLGACVVIGAVLGDARLRSWFGAAWLLWLGRRSYSLYLTHLLVVMTVIIACHGAVPLWACAAVLPISVAVAAGFYRWVELPSIKWAQGVLGYTSSIRRPRRPMLSPLVPSTPIGKGLAHPQ